MYSASPPVLARVGVSGYDPNPNLDDPSFTFRCTLRKVTSTNPAGQ